MAKLSAHNRTELFRMVKYTRGARVSYAFMDDGVVLTKLDILMDNSTRVDYPGHWRVAYRGVDDHKVLIESLKSAGYRTE